MLSEALCRVLGYMLFGFFFFFSSRRRHTRLQGDWSSDVCSSDLSYRPKSLKCSDSFRTSAIGELTKAMLPNASFLIHKSWWGDPPIPELVMLTCSSLASESVPSPFRLPGATMVRPLEMLSRMVIRLMVRPEMLRRSMQIWSEPRQAQSWS